MQEEGGDQVPLSFYATPFLGALRSKIKFRFSEESRFKPKTAG